MNDPEVAKATAEHLVALWQREIPTTVAVLSAVGFAIVLLNFLPVAYFFARSHNFA